MTWDYLIPAGCMGRNTKIASTSSVLSSLKFSASLLADIC